MTLHNSPVESIDFSPILNVFVSASNTGEVILFIGDSRRSSSELGKIKNTSAKRSFLYRTELKMEAEDFEFVKTLNEMKQKYPDLSLKFIDKCSNIHNLDEQEWTLLKQKDALPWEDCRKYPIASVTTVNFSPKLDTKSWIFTGSASGLARLLRVSNFE